jgi:hypothetical protein
MANILNWKLVLATAILSSVAFSASANQASPVIMPDLAVKGGVMPVRIIARAGRHHLKLEQKKRAENKRRTENKKKGRYSYEAGRSR